MKDRTFEIVMPIVAILLIIVILGFLLGVGHVVNLAYQSYGDDSCIELGHEEMTDSYNLKYYIECDDKFRYHREKANITDKWGKNIDKTIYVPIPYEHQNINDTSNEAA